MPKTDLTLVLYTSTHVSSMSHIKYKEEENNFYGGEDAAATSIAVVMTVQRQIEVSRKYFAIFYVFVQPSFC